MTPKQALTTTQEIIFPESDGKPMAETDVHLNLMVDLIKTLQLFYRSDPNTYVSGNLLIYWNSTNPLLSVAPDVFVVKGVQKKKRRVYKLWEEGKGPDMVIEITSKSTKEDDLKRKRELYCKVLHVQEYFLFDPEQEYLPSQLMGFRLEGKNYQPIEGTNGLSSEVLGLDLILVGQQFRLYDPMKKATLRIAEETEEALIHAQVRADQAQALAQIESLAREKAEAELKKLRLEMKKLRKESGKK